MVWIWPSDPSRTDFLKMYGISIPLKFRTFEGRQDLRVV